MKMNRLSKDRIDPPTDHFDCAVCKSIVIAPKQCRMCGALYCSPCHLSWMTSHKTCVASCPSSQIGEMSKSLYRVYNDLIVRCIYYEECKEKVSLSSLEGHQNNCRVEKCAHFDICSNSLPAKKMLRGKYCSQECYILAVMREAGNPKAVLDFLIIHFKPNQDLLEELYWDAFSSSQLLSVNMNTVHTKIPTSSFCTAFASNGLKTGRHYWELRFDSSTNNDMKVGVSTTNQIPTNKAFSDFDTGFAFYGLGQLRNGSDCSGASYGKKWRNQEVLGVFLDMRRGILAFSIDGEYMGVAYQLEALKKSPIYPAVAILNTGGCIIESKPVPNVFNS